MITLLLPGMDGTGRLFSGLLNELPQSLGAVAIGYPVDQPLGYNELAELVDKSIPDEGPWAMVAESFSGPLAIRLAARHPERLRGLVLAASFAECPLRGVSWLGGLAGPVVALRRNSPAFMLRFWIAGSDATDGFVADTRATAQSVVGRVMAHRLRAVLSADERETLRDLKTPLLILAASRDRLVGPRAIKRLCALRPDATCVTLNAPHMLLQRNPKECATEISNFLTA